MIQNYKKNIFVYNKNNELTTYVDLEENGKVVNYYNIADRNLTKFNSCTYKEKNKIYNDVKKAKITFEEDCMLHHLFIDGESRVVAIKTGNSRIEYPKAVSKLYSHNDTSIEGYTLNSGLIQDWIKKL